MDIGDIIGVEGYVFKTKTGEISVHVTSIDIAFKIVETVPIAKEGTTEEGKK